MVGFISVVFRILAECAKIMLISCSVMKAKYNRDKKWYVAILGVIFVVCGFERFVRHGQDEWWTIYLMEIVFSSVLLVDRMTNRIFKVFISSCFINIVDSIVMTGISYLILGRRVSMSESLVTIIISEVGTISVYILLVLLKNKISRGSYENYNETSVGFVIISVVDILCCILMVGGTQLILNDETNSTLKTFVAIGVMFVCILITVLTIVQFFLYNSRNYYRELLIAKEKNMQMKHNYYEAQQKNYQEMMEFRHDIKRHLRYVYELNDRGKKEEIGNYINQMNLAIDKSCDMLECGNDIVNVVLTDADAKAKKNNIKFQFEGHLPNKLTLNEMEICTIFGNVLENAIEACMEYQGEAYIKTKFLVNDNKIITIIKNSTNVLFMKKNQKMSSHKLGDRHGIGMSNVKEIVEKHAGSISWKIDNNEFEIVIVI